MTEAPLLETRQLSVTYFGRIVAVSGLSLHVQRGEIVAIIGPNGAGKTSSLRAIAGFLRREPAAVSGGQVLFAGHALVGMAPYRVSQLGIALVPERDKVFLELTPLEHFRLVSGARGSEFKRDLDQVLEVFPALEPHLKRPAGLFSGGQRQMLAFAAALFAKPKVLLVDEFSQGLAPIMVRSLTESIRRINAEGMTVLLVEQNASLALAMCSRIYVLDAGRVVASGTSAEISSEGSIARTYLGDGGGATPQVDA